MAVLKQVLKILPPGSQHWVGNGFPVRNYFPSHDLGPSISPFLLLDYAGPREFPPSEEPRGVGEHPHRGFETVTVIYQGRLSHRDSAGHSGILGPGDVQWMTAGSGVVHEEMHEREFAKRGGTVEMIQLWVNLPKELKGSKPRYQDIPKEKIPVVSLPEEAGEVRVLAGAFEGVPGPAQTHTPVNLWDVHLRPQHSITFFMPPEATSAIFVLRGALKINEKQELREAELALLSPEGDSLQMEVASEVRMLLLNGEPIREPVVQRGPFVMNTLGEIRQAMEDYQSGKMGHLA